MLANQGLLDLSGAFTINRLLPSRVLFGRLFAGVRWVRVRGLRMRCLWMIWLRVRSFWMRRLRAFRTWMRRVLLFGSRSGYGQRRRQDDDPGQSNQFVAPDLHSVNPSSSAPTMISYSPVWRQSR